MSWDDDWLEAAYEDRTYSRALDNDVAFLAEYDDQYEDDDEAEDQ